MEKMEFAAKNLTMGQMNAVVKKLGGEDVIRRLLSGEVVMQAVPKTSDFITHTFTVLVDETKTVKEQVEDGKFGWKDDNFPLDESFPKPINGQKLEREIFLFHFNFDREISAKVIIAEMDKSGYRPATIWELLALARKKRDLHKEFFGVVALGSSCGYGGKLNVPSICVDPSGRGLFLNTFGGSWYGSSHWFIAVRK